MLVQIELLAHFWGAALGQGKGLSSPYSDQHDDDDDDDDDADVDDDDDDDDDDDSEGGCGL